MGGGPIGGGLGCRFGAENCCDLIPGPASSNAPPVLQLHLPRRPREGDKEAGARGRCDWPVGRGPRGAGPRWIGRVRSGRSGPARRCLAEGWEPSCAPAATADPGGVGEPAGVVRMGCPGAAGADR